MAHSIRLSGPWEVKPLDGLTFQDDGSTAPRRVQMPASWQSLFGYQGGNAVFIRYFHRPTGLKGQRITISLQEVRGDVNIRMNDTRIKEVQVGEEYSLDVTNILSNHNHLELHIHCEDMSVPCGLHQLVYLHIHEDYVRLV